MQNLISYKFYCGRDRRGQSEVSGLGLRIFYEWIHNNFSIGGHTSTKCEGYYKHSDGELIKENSVVIEIIAEPNTFGDKEASQIANKYCELFNQESVLIVKNEVAAGFIINEGVKS